MADAANGEHGGAPPPPAPVAAAAAAGRAALRGGVDGGWTVLMPAAAAAEWRVMVLGGGQSAAGTRAAGASSSTGGGGGGAPEVVVDMATLLAESGAGGGFRVGEGFMDGGGVGRFVAGRGGWEQFVEGRGGAGQFVEGRGGAEQFVAGHGGEGGDAGGHGDAGRPYLLPVPVVFIPNFKKEPKEDKGLTIAKVIYGLLLFGPLSFIGPMNTILQAKEIGNSVMWQGFGMCWGFLSIGFHMSFHVGRDHLRRAYIQNIAHFSLMVFCSFMIYYLYLLQPSTPQSLQWLIVMEVHLAFGHIMAWFWVARTTALNHVASSRVLPIGPSVWSKAQQRWTRLRQVWLSRLSQGWTTARQVRWSRLRQGWTRLRQGWWSRMKQGWSRMRRE